MLVKERLYTDDAVRRQTTISTAAAISPLAGFVCMQNVKLSLVCCIRLHSLCPKQSKQQEPILARLVGATWSKRTQRQLNTSPIDCSSNFCHT